MGEGGKGMKEGGGRGEKVVEEEDEREEGVKRGWF